MLRKEFVLNLYAIKERNVFIKKEMYTEAVCLQIKGMCPEAECRQRK